MLLRLSLSCIVLFSARITFLYRSLFFCAHAIIKQIQYLCFTLVSYVNVNSHTSLHFFVLSFVLACAYAYVASETKFNYAPYMISSNSYGVTSIKL